MPLQHRQCFLNFFPFRAYQRNQLLRCALVFIILRVWIDGFEIVHCVFNRLSFIVQLARLTFKLARLFFKRGDFLRGVSLFLLQFSDPLTDALSLRCWLSGWSALSLTSQIPARSCGLCATACEQNGGLQSRQHESHAQRHSSNRRHLYPTASR